MAGRATSRARDRFPKTRAGTGYLNVAVDANKAAHPAGRHGLDRLWPQGFRHRLRWRQGRSHRAHSQKSTKPAPTQEREHCHSLTGPRHSRLDCRSWKCPSRRAEHDRDYNSAKIIRQSGLKEMNKAFFDEGQGKSDQAAP